MDLLAWLLQPKREERPQSCVVLLEHPLFDPSSDTKRTETLHFAAATGDADLLDRILERDDDLAIPSNMNPLLGETALHRAAKEGHVDIVDRLLNVPATEVDALDAERSTPLQATLKFVQGGLLGEDQEKLVVIVEKLMVRADLSLKDADGNTSFHLMRTNKVPAVRQLLDRVVEQAIANHRPFAVEDFDALYRGANAKKQEELRQAVFDLLWDWAFAGDDFEHASDGEKYSSREYLKLFVFQLAFLEEPGYFDQLKSIATKASLERVLPPM